MTKEFTMAATAVVLLFLSIQSGYSFRVLRQSKQPMESLDSDYYLAPKGEFLQPRSISDSAELPEELKQDIARVVGIVEKEEEKLGRGVTEEEMREIEKQLQEAPWYQKFNNWLHGAFRSTKTAVKGVFSKRQVTRKERGYPDFYGFYSD